MRSHAGGAPTLFGMNVLAHLSGGPDGPPMSLDRFGETFAAITTHVYSPSLFSLHETSCAETRGAADPTNANTAKCSETTSARRDRISLGPPGLEEPPSGIVFEPHEPGDR